MDQTLKSVLLDLLSTELPLQIYLINNLQKHSDLTMICACNYVYPGDILAD